MFRKPRESDGFSNAPEVVGRPPSPRGTPAKTPFTLSTPPTVPAPRMATKTRPSKAIPLPTIGRQGPASSKKATPAKTKLNSKGNGSILSFFKKSEGGDEDVRLFVEDRRHSPDRAALNEIDGTVEEGVDEDNEPFRFNEAGGSVKRRKTDSAGETEAMFDSPMSNRVSSDPAPLTIGRKAGPFLEESDSEPEEEDALEAIVDVDQAPSHSMQVGTAPLPSVGQIEESGDDGHASVQDTGDSSLPTPPLIKEETSCGPDLDDFKDFEDMGDFDEDQFEEGDEYLERKYMEEQARLDDEYDEKDYDPIVKTEVDEGTCMSVTDGPTCPICGASLSEVSEQDAGLHVNNCLDGNPTPLPPKTIPPSPMPVVKSESTTSPHLFRKPGRAPKPGQASPFTLGQANINGGSAFNKLMSGHVEDAAWAEAAAAEHAARGKPSYQRTCPFYKILPGLFICVDAFRYGAVQGCQAYFLSHFHSDHYVGLTASWSHGPIYCSKVTANLVRQQLRVDPKYVIGLEWETPIVVPGTKGVTVTMISANHCPGSSLYLFDKTVGKKQNGEPRTQRILHCGDFRACKMHVQHPLLMPDVQDRVSGKIKEQKIDVCYLDTTYLNPKYAFPSQENVIRACADMCVCLSKDTPDETDGWEQMKRQRAGEGMVKFVRRESTAEVKEEPSEEAEADNVKVEKNPLASQQILSSVNEKKTRGRLLVIVGTYSIGKERICLGIAKALDSKIYAPPSKQRIVAALEDPELNARMTSDPRAAQVHMTPLFEIRAETLDDYLKDYWPHFTRAVGFRPSGWNYRPPNSRFTESPAVQTVLYSDNWKSTYSMRDLVPQRGSSSRASCFGVPYSEHSSFRELTMFCCALRIEKIIPTVNVGSAKSRERMKAWCERWAVERKKSGLYKIPEDGRW